MVHKGYKRSAKVAFIIWVLILCVCYGGLASAAVVPDEAAAADLEVRIKDIARLKTVRHNQLVGLGLVVGLNGTGDGANSQANVEMVTNMLRQFGVSVDAKFMRTRNVAAVMVTADLPAFARMGDVVDVTVASLGDARSLSGGLLLQTPLQGADGQIYAVAQGPVVIGGQSDAHGRVVRTHSLTGRVVGGAIVENEIYTNILENDTLTLVLAAADFSTASRVATAINTAVGEQIAQALDGSSIEVQVPEALLGNAIDFLAAIEELPVRPDAPARVVVNERTGTVVIGGRVRVAPIAVAHGQLSVRIAQPQATGTSTSGSAAPIWPPTSSSDQSVLLSGANVEDVVQGLNAIGATPKDIVALLQAIKAAGALFGELVVI